MSLSHLASNIHNNQPDHQEEEISNIFKYVYRVEN